MSDGVPRCSASVCAQYAQAVAQACAENPRAEKILIPVPPDGWCYCDCPKTAARAAGGEASGAEGAAPPSGGTPHCHGSDCHMNPQLVDLCQDFAAGHPALVRDAQGRICICLCWDGKLAPYTVKDGDGCQVPLDALPAGGFVTAAGIGLDWKKMPVRYASRPFQASPQDAIRVTLYEGGEMVVPTSHLFLTYQKKLILAGQMISSIALMGNDAAPAVVDDVEHIVTFNVFQFVATADDTPDETLRYHLLDSSGVVSGDYAVQRAYAERRLPAKLLAFPYGWETAAAKMEKGDR